MWILWALGCTPPQPDAVQRPAGLLGDAGTTETFGAMAEGWLNPFPSMHLMDSDRVALPELVPFEGGSRLPVERVSWRTGFSVAQPIVIHLPSVDASALPHWRSPTPGQGGVLLADLTTNTWLPVMAELDAYPDVEHPSLVIRPLVALEPGHQIGVALTTEVAPRPESYDELLRGEAGPTLGPWEEHYTNLMAQLEGMGAAEISLAWDFPVGVGDTPLTSALSQLDVAPAWSFDSVRALEDGDTVPPLTWLAAEGRFTVQDFLVDDLTLDLQDDGSVVSTGTTTSDLYVHIPTSVAEAPAGTVPVVLFGHGILSRPADYLNVNDDPSGVLALAEEGGFILVGTTWRGLTYTDRAEAVLAASDIGRLNLVPDRLAQGLVNTRTLAELLVEHDLLEDAVFRGAQGQLLPDTSRLYYYGISLGAIEGSVLLATGAPIDAAVFHVGGGAWSTMLERSSNWLAFELFVASTVTSAHERQFLYSLSQLWWDPVDPLAYSAQLAERDFLLQESIGDEQVPNLTTRMLARSVDLPVLEPAVEVPWGLTSVPAPLPPGSRALTQFHPQLPLPDDDNRPAAVTHAHHTPRLWAGARLQTIDHLTQGSEARVVHHCGTDPCTAENTGD